MPFRIWIERLDDTGAVRDRHSLHYRFSSEKSARLKADDLARPHINRRYVPKSGSWELTETDGTVVRIVVEPA